ncbi:FKBP-type peptidyl-prolyl cis-trans isomerase [Flaviaesturariibacter amylovorans]|uniref:peptidylprolyl isomerase n=1 Tax=Flaviaesturariibacter amylovorans TaxID=1084520 RepID=A0ABP8GXV5_9BACT
MHFKNLLPAAALALLAAGCNNVDFKKTRGGMPYKLYTKGGTKVKPGEVMKIHFTQKVNDSTLHSTYTTGPIYFDYTGQTTPYDLTEVFPLLHKNDSVVAVQVIDSLIKRVAGGQLPPGFKKGDKITTNFKVINIFPNRDAARADETAEREKRFQSDTKVQAQLQQDIQALTALLQQQGIQAQKTPSGVFVQVLAPGAGPAVKKGDFVSIRYRGTTVDGKEFDSNMDTTGGAPKPPLQFPVGEGQMIKGFDEAVQLLKKGDRARIWIPSPLAYGANSPSPAIAPNSNLIFELFVTDVADKAAMPQPRAGAGAGGHSADDGHGH